ncbi:hypothetical protein [Streptomyces albus]|uniref:hypothetical protein n=1 Tax=Streptomyces albus TaxID=1888 RepID=UPI003F1A9BF6
MIKVQAISVGMHNRANGALVPLILEKEMHIQERPLVLTGSGRDPLTQLAVTPGQATSLGIGSEVSKRKFLLTRSTPIDASVYELPAHVGRSPEHKGGERLTSSLHQCMRST